MIADLVGKGKHIRTVPVPLWAKRAVGEWIGAAAITDGTIFRRVSRLDKIWGDGITPKAIWHVVKAAAKRADIKNLAPRDLRRTCARLCHLAGGEREQIQFFAWTRIGSDHRTLSGLQTEIARRSQRQPRSRERLNGATVQDPDVGTRPPHFTPSAFLVADRHHNTRRFL